MHGLSFLSSCDSVYQLNLPIREDLASPYGVGTPQTLTWLWLRKGLRVFSELQSQCVYLLNQALFPPCTHWKCHSERNLLVHMAGQWGWLTLVCTNALGY